LINCKWYSVVLGRSERKAFVQLFVRPQQPKENLKDQRVRGNRTNIHLYFTTTDMTTLQQSQRILNYNIQKRIEQHICFGASFLPDEFQCKPDSNRMTQKLLGSLFIPGMRFRMLCFQSGLCFCAAERQHRATPSRRSPPPRFKTGG
jgi:hypothetical protein